MQGWTNAAAVQPGRSFFAPLLRNELAAIALFAASELYVALHVPAMAAAFAVQAAVLAGLCWATSRLTEQAPERRAAPGALLWLQIAVCLLVPLAALARGNFTALATAGTFASPWTQWHHVLYERFARISPADIALGLVNFTDYALIAGLLLLVLGVRARDMGLGAFRRGTPLTALCWLALPTAAATLSIFFGRAAPAALLRAFGGNLLQNGVSEEFLFRGALLGRLRAMWSTRTALLAQAVLFGLWHLSGDLAQARGALLLAIALALANHAIMGYAMGFVTVRSGNIAIASTFHALLDTVFG